MAFVEGMRRIFAIGAVLLISGAFTLAADLGSCGAKPCCRHSEAVAISAAVCCSQPVCVPAPPPDIRPNDSGASAHAPLSAVRSNEVFPLPRPISILAGGDDCRVPGTSRRLAALSVLLI